ncbi:hypothetical protein G6F46_007495 [Rhizopus delemar]|nr:hypothetical protein G6F55_009882 [Rhizopus delemar]KAG1541855.1 hypothetical protein G6F51_007631 [Rhizopus arrhizus]KAG1491008.1 hypothetical protein G6F54_010324 [Rhizopus delemar]KAG1504003.1 hypothetical protein G6F53_010495 [Rhizopus delemar]KAG1521433.1 hypothetical protein G6F52_006755 [Rhizopus delemar]
MEKAIHSLGGMQLIEEAVRRQQQQMMDEKPIKIEEAGDNKNRFLMNEMGSPYYIQEIISLSSTGDSTIGSQSRSSSPTRQDELVQLFMLQIQPYFSLFVPDYFNQLYSASEIPTILVYAICSLSSQQEEEKRFYYQRTITLLDEWVGRPSIEIIQTLLLLTKYTECHPEGYFEKSKSLLSRAIELCKLLELDRVIYQLDTDSETETKRRTFYVLTRYHVLLCVEQNIELDLLLLKDYPQINEDIERHLFGFSFTLSHIYHHLRRITKRQEVQLDHRNDPQIVQETLSVMQLQFMIDDQFLRLPPHLLIQQQKQPKFPADEIPSHLSFITKLVHVHHHLNLILLHFHYTRYPLPHGSTKVVQYPHRDIALSSASAMIRWIEGCMTDVSFRFIPRGIQFLTYCSALALSVLSYLSPKDSDHQRGLDLTRRISLQSPFLEVQSFVTPKPRRNTISDRPMQPIPPSFLQLSSTDLSFHQPLHNMHAAPLQLEKPRTLRTTTTQSCVDLRAMNQQHFYQHRKPVGSVISSSTSTSPSLVRPYRHTSPTRTSFVKPYERQVNKIRKSSSLHGLSNHYQTHSVFQPIPPTTPYQTALLDSNDLSEFSSGVEFDFYTHSMLPDERTEGHPLL